MRPKKEQASFLLEAVLTATIAVVTLAIIAPMFVQYVETVKRTKDLQQLEQLIGKDIDAYRQYARHWKHLTGPGSDYVLNPKVSAFSTGAKIRPQNQTSTYQPTSSACTPFQPNQINLLTFSFDTDSGANRLIGGDNLPSKKLETQNYLVKRSLVLSDESGTLPFLRLQYEVKPKSPKIWDPKLTRTVDIQIEAQNWC